jgi:uncharacterized membrane protein YjjP (DUF1212 family)
MTFGAPSHRIEGQLAATCNVLEVDAQFVHMPNIIIASFGDHDHGTAQTHFIKVAGRLALGQLHRTHNIYKQVVHDEIGVEEGSRMLTQLLREPPHYGFYQRCFIAFVCAGIICPLAFQGSFLDMWVSGAGGATLAYLQLGAASKSAMYANVFEWVFYFQSVFNCLFVSSKGLRCPC